MTRKRAIRALAQLAATVLFVTTRGHAGLDPSKAISQYTHEAWQNLKAGALLLLMVLCWTRDALGLDRAKQIDRCGHDVWTSQNGLPGEAVYQILQSPDGYLWLRTSAGLVRFDGVRFALAAREGLPSNAVQGAIKAQPQTASDLVPNPGKRQLLCKARGVREGFRRLPSYLNPAPG